MKAEVEFESLKEFIDNLKEMGDAEISQSFLNKVVARCDNVTKKNTPVRQVNGGTLRNGWKFKMRGNGKHLEADYYNDTDYATYVEYGHRTRDHKKWVIGHFMLTKGIQAVERSRTKIAKSVIEKAYKGKFK